MVVFICFIINFYFSSGLLKSIFIVILHFYIIKLGHKMVYEQKRLKQIKDKLLPGWPILEEGGGRWSHCHLLDLEANYTRWSCVFLGYLMRHVFRSPPQRR